MFPTIIQWKQTRRLGWTLKRFRQTINRLIKKELSRHLKVFARPTSVTPPVWSNLAIYNNDLVWSDGYILGSIFGHLQQWKYGHGDSWVVSHSALNISILCHTLGHEFDKLLIRHKHKINAGLFDLELLFVLWIAKHKIENKRLFYKKTMKRYPIAQTCSKVC